jgi:hypothetical protein
MKILLNSATKRVLDRVMKYGSYEKPEDAVLAGLCYVEQVERSLQRNIGEIKSLVQEHSLNRGRLATQLRQKPIRSAPKGRNSGRHGKRAT